jgi:hypothetical protein
MPIFSSVIKSVDPSAVAKSVPIKSLDVNVKPLSSQPIRPIDPSAPKPAGGAGVGSTVALGGLALSSMIPSILNSSAVSTAINAGAIAGTVDNVVAQLTENPTNMAIAAVAGVAVIYLLFR